MDSVKGARVLVVGAGGIGCELLKTLALSGFRHVHVIDMDTVEVSNLNRQLLFRKSDVGLSKAKVAKDAVMRFRPAMNVVPYHANIKGREFNVEFFKKFDVVLNGLDNLDARRHVNRLCLAADVPLVESGTAGFLGQVTVHVKGKTECYECQPKPIPKTYPVCTITSTPSKFVHCVVWAKELLFTKLFGEKDQVNDLTVHRKEGNGLVKHEEDVFVQLPDEDFDTYGCRIYDHLFGYNIEVALSNEDTWRTRKKPTPKFIRHILPNAHILENVCLGKFMSESGTISAMFAAGLRNQQEIWSLAENTKVFLKALNLLLIKREKDNVHLTFDKDDQLSMEFVTAAANIRAACFCISPHSLFETKGIAGNIVQAVATTNSIIAGLIVIEAMKVLQNEKGNIVVAAYQPRTTYCVEHPRKKMLLMPVEPCQPNKSCYVCSEMPLLLEVNTTSCMMKDFVEKIVQNKLGMNSPLIMHGSTLLYEVGDDLEKDVAAIYALNLKKVLSELPAPVTNGTILTVEDLQQEFSCNITMKHREEFEKEKGQDGMILSGWRFETTQADAQATSNEESLSTVSQDTLVAEDTSDPVEVCSKDTKELTLAAQLVTETPKLTEENNFDR